MKRSYVLSSFLVLGVMIVAGTLNVIYKGSAILWQVEKITVK